MEEKKKEILKRSREYADSRGFSLCSDEKALDAVISGLAKRESEDGKPYCPCRVNTGNPEEDAKNVCPCAYHEREIEEDGHCKCRLFCSK